MGSLPHVIARFKRAIP